MGKRKMPALHRAQFKAMAASRLANVRCKATRQGQLCCLACPTYSIGWHQQCPNLLSKHCVIFQPHSPQGQAIEDMCGARVASKDGPGYPQHQVGF